MEHSSRDWILISDWSILPDNKLFPWDNLGLQSATPHTLAFILLWPFVDTHCYKKPYSRNIQELIKKSLITLNLTKHWHEAFTADWRHVGNILNNATNSTRNAAFQGVVETTKSVKIFQCWLCWSYSYKLSHYFFCWYLNYELSFLFILLSFHVTNPF